MYRLSAICIILGTAAFAQQTDHQAILIAAFKNEGCSIVVPQEAQGRGFESWFSGKLVEVSDIPLNAWLDQTGPHYKAVDDTMSAMIETGKIQIDVDTFTMTLTDC